MFIGHFALGFAAKQSTSRVPLAVLFLAAQWADLVWPVFVAIGVEQVRIDPGNTAVTPLDFVSYPYSHSLVFLTLWGLGFGFLYSLVSGNRRALPVLAALVISHWVLDFVTHRPDMPLYPGGPRLGLGLWNSVAATVSIELVLFGIGLWIYGRATRPVDGIGRWGLPSFALFLLLAYVGNLFGPPPPSVRALYVAALLGGLILLIWSSWVDRHRVQVM